MYTDNHLRYVAAGIIKLFKHRDGITGLKRIYATKLLSHFTARFEPIEGELTDDSTNGTTSTGAQRAAEAVSQVASSAADKLVQGWEKLGLGSDNAAAAVAAAPAGELEEASTKTDIAANGVHDSFAQEVGAQSTEQRQSW